LAWDDTLLTLTAPDGTRAIEAPRSSAHRLITLDELYTEGQIGLITPCGVLTFRKHAAALAGVRQCVETGLAGDPEFCAALRRQALRAVPRGLIVAAVSGGLFGLYCWWTWNASDPPPGSWLRWALVTFGWLIHGVLLVLMAAALAGPLVAYSGLRQWLRVWLIERRGVRAELRAPFGTPPITDESATENTSRLSDDVMSSCARPSKVRMECPRCASERVERLPPSGITPHPGYRCGACGVVMRAWGMWFPYLVVLALGSGLVGLFLFMLFDRTRSDPMPLRAFWLIGLGLVCAGHAVLQLMRPVPRRCRSDDAPA